MRAICACLVLAFPPVATAGVYGRISGDLGPPPRPPDCSLQSPTNQNVPAWSRLQWSLAGGAAWRYDDDWSASLVAVPQASWQFWVREHQCAPGSGLFTSLAWRRISLAVSTDLAIRNAPTDPIDVRPALRLARATYETGLLSVGSRWTPSWELSLTAGPTFDPRWSGAAVSFGVRASIFNLELRVGARTESRGQELMLLFAIADVHGLWKLGPDREWQND